MAPCWQGVWRVIFKICVIFERQKVDFENQTYTKTEACKLYSRVFWIFLPNVIKIDPYNVELYRFKVCAFFLRQCKCATAWTFVNKSIHRLISAAPKLVGLALLAAASPHAGAWMSALRRWQTARWAEHSALEGRPEPSLGFTCLDWSTEALEVQLDCASRAIGTIKPRPH